MSTHSWFAIPRKCWSVIAICFIVSVVALIWLLPRESKFGYIYEVGKPWRYQQLIASYDFPILKTEAEIKAERDSIASRFSPYFAVDSIVAPSEKQRFQNAFLQGTLSGMSPAAFRKLDDLFAHVYEVGIVDAEEAKRIASKGRGEVRLLSGATSTHESIENFFTIRTAYDYIIQQVAEDAYMSSIQEWNLNDFIAVNLKPDDAKNAAEIEGEQQSVITNIGMVQSGQLIVDRGQIVTDEVQRILNSLREQENLKSSADRDRWAILAGQTGYVLLAFVVLIVYLHLFRRDYLFAPHVVTLLFSLVTLFPLIAYALVTSRLLSVYVLPFAIVPMFVRIFLDSRTAFIALLVTTLLAALPLHAPFDFVLIQMFCGVSAIYSLRELTERSQIFRTVVGVVLVGLFVSASYDLSQGITTEALDRSRLVHMVASGMLLLLAYPLMYLVERMFRFTSSVTLIELNNINAPILRRLSKEAQGTFIHSMQVANLAAEVADVVGARVLLVRTGALYHDIGKLANPPFFTENQSGVNPHDKLKNSESAQIIVAHVAEGIRLAEKAHLPSVIIDFIRTHHGAGQTKYFYIKEVNEHPEEEVDKSLFSYPGPNPQTREQAILMMCDSVEAASRSLPEYSEEAISALVTKIVDGQMAEGFFRECPLTFRDIEDAKRTLVDSLKTIYHTRISYPELNRPAQTTEPQTIATTLFGGTRRRRGRN